MSSLFDSTVYQARREMEWAEIDLDYFLKDLAGDDTQKRPVRLEVHARPSVRTRFWWTLTWHGVDGQEHQMSGETMQLCLWRAACREKQLRAQRHEAEEEEEEEEHPSDCDCEDCGIARMELVLEAEARMRRGE